MVEPLSLDEAYLDVTEACARGPSPAMEIAARIRDAIRSELHLTASAGIAPNKMVAKIASDVNKPDGQCVVRPEKVFEFMRGLPVRRIPFVGPRTDDRLGELGYRTCEDLVRAGPGKLTEAVGNGALALWWRAQGIDLSPVSPSRERKSCGEEQTFARDLRTREEMRSELAKIASALWSYVSLKGFSGRTLTLKVKYHDFRCVTRRATSPDVVRGEGALLSLASELLARTDAGRVPVRLLGISLSNLGPLDSSCQRVPTEDERVPDDGAFG
jgi:DNA polymerase-4